MNLTKLEIRMIIDLIDEKAANVNTATFKLITSQVPPEERDEHFNKVLPLISNLKYLHQKLEKELSVLESK